MLHVDFKKKAKKNHFLFFIAIVVCYFWTLDVYLCACLHSFFFFFFVTEETKKI